MTSQISADHFEAFVTSSVNDIFSHVRAKGALSSLFVCGDATRNLEKMCQTGCDNISIDENIPLEKVRDLTRGGNKSFGGNLRLTTALLLGTEDDAKLDAIRCIDMGGGCGFVLAPGCDLPYATPEQNLQAVAVMVHDQYQREVAKRTIIARSADEAGQVVLPDYDALSHVTMDVITLDSASCAPCHYMLDAAHRAAKQVGQPVVIKEHKITTREGLRMMLRLGVKNLPTICIDGQPSFVSLIPDQQTLVQAIRERAARKGRP
jgi:uroporphyrinogen decarboxylase